MNWLHWFRVLLFPMTAPVAQQQVDRIERSLAALRAKVAALPPDQRDAQAQEIHTLLVAQARARAVLADALDDRAER